MITLFQVMLGVFFSVLPSRFHKLMFLKSELSNPSFYFSGRVAIYYHARLLRSFYSEVLLPDYLCNVVYRSFEEAGFTTIPILTDAENELCIDDLKEKVASLSRPPILCVAPILGSDGGQTWLLSKAGKTWRNENKLFLFFDFCQDISRVFNISFKDEVNYVIVASFNNKSFPGFMGAVSYSDIKSEKTPKSKLGNEVFVLYSVFIRIVTPLYGKIKTIFKSKKRNPDDKIALKNFDYSFCNQFPFSFEIIPATRVQIGLGCAGMIFLATYNKRKQDIQKKIVHQLKQTPFMSNSPYVIVKHTVPDGFKIKLPYAIQGNPEKSLRPEIKAIEIKGFENF